MFSKSELYFGDCQNKVDIARAIFKELGEDLFSEKICLSLQQMKDSHKKLICQMERVDFTYFCSRCAVSDGGGCCSLYMADENEVLQLLMNLMVGINIDFQRIDGSECYFLSDKGCVLSFKPMFCLNYDCLAVKQCEDQDAFNDYENACADLLKEQWQLEQLLLEKLQVLGLLRTGT